MTDEQSHGRGRDTVIYDGECGVCNKAAGYLQSMDRAHALVFIPYQSANLAHMSPGLTPSMTNRAMYVVEPDGHRYGGARAMFALLRRLPRLWGVVGSVGFFQPLSLLAEPFYRLFAHNRRTVSRWLGLAECPIPDSIKGQMPRSPGG